MSDMGTFRTTILIESVEHRGEMRVVDDALVDAGSRPTCWRVLGSDPSVRNGSSSLTVVSSIDRWALGVRSLEGLNVRVDAQRKQLVPAGPILAGTLAL